MIALARIAMVPVRRVNCEVQVSREAVCTAAECCSSDAMDRVLQTC